MEIEVVDIANRIIKHINAKVTIADKGSQHTPFIIPLGICWKCGHRSTKKCNKCNTINNFGLTEEFFKKIHEYCNGDILTSLKLLGDKFDSYKQQITTEDISIATKFIDRIEDKRIVLEKKDEEYYIDGRYFEGVQLRRYNDEIYWLGTTFKFKEVVRKLYCKDITEASFIIAYANKGYKLRLTPHRRTINISFKVTPLIYFL